MTIDEQLAWYDALTEVRWKLRQFYDDEWTDHILDLQDKLWWSSHEFRTLKTWRGATE